MTDIIFKEKVNTVPEGYKMTSAGIIPKDWDVKKLKDIGLFRKGKNISTKDTIDSGLPAMMYGDIYVKYDTFFYDVDYRISEDTASKSTPISNMDLLFTCSGETAKEIGKCVCYTGGETVYIGGDILAFTQNKQDSLFMAYQQNGYHQIKQKARLGQGHSVVHIYEKHLSSLKVPLPSLSEQRKIAEILSLQDRIIELKKKLLEEKEKQKKYLMQALLTKSCENEEWGTLKLGSIITNIQRKIKKPTTGYWRLGLKSHGKGTFHKYINNPDEVMMEYLFQVKENDLIINITFAWEQAIAVADKDDSDKLVSHRFPTYIFNNANNPRFFKYFLLTKKFKQQLNSISPGGAGRNRVLSKTNFLKLKVNIPSPDEQNRISNILMAIDNEIKILKVESNYKKDIKKALMQILLTGKVRVKV